MEITLRRLQKVRKVGNSLIITLPTQAAADLSLKEGDQLAVYQLDRALVIFPMADLPKSGAPRALARIGKLIQIPAP